MIKRLTETTFLFLYYHKTRGMYLITLNLHYMFLCCIFVCIFIPFLTSSSIVVYNIYIEGPLLVVYSLWAVWLQVVVVQYGRYGQQGIWVSCHSGTVSLVVLYFDKNH